MKFALRGGTVDHRNPLPYEWRLYRLVKLTGWTIEQIETTPAMTLDWILAFDNTEREIAAEREREARR